MQVLVAGATGAVGAELVRTLSSEGHDVVGFGRKSGGASLVWDPTASGEPQPELRRRWDAVVNAAGDTRWHADPAAAYRNNVEVLSGLLPLCDAQTRFVQISTAYAAPRADDLDTTRIDSFKNPYEWSKFQAEVLIEERCESALLVRPPLLIGSRQDGYIARFNGLYTLMRGACTGTLAAAIGDGCATVQLASTSDVARVVSTDLESDRTPGIRRTTLGLMGDGVKLEVLLATMTDALNSWRTESGVDPIGNLPIVDEERWERFFRPFLSSCSSETRVQSLERLAQFAAYSSHQRQYEPNVYVEPIEPALELAVRYWAQKHRKLAQSEPRTWRFQ